MSDEDSIQIRGLARTLRLQLASNAWSEALMQVYRASFEQQNILKLQRFLTEMIKCDKNHQHLGEETASDAGILQTVDRRRYLELEAGLTLLNGAYEEFRRAFDAKNHPLFVRWMDEWKERRTKWEKAAQKEIEELSQQTFVSG